MVQAGIRAAVVAERTAQVALYESLTEAQWKVPSLCAGWDVHRLLAHTTMPLRYSLPRVLLEGVEVRGTFDRMADRRARADAADLTPAQLLATLRENVAHPWALAGMSPTHIAALGVDLAGVELRATDADWSHGSGDVVSGRAQDLLLVLCGSEVPPARLSGDGLPHLSRTPR